MIDLGALLEILLGYLCQILIEDHHAMPFGALLAFTRLLVPPVFAGRQLKMNDGPTILGTADFRIGAEVADQNDFVD